MSDTWTNLEITFPAGVDLDAALDLAPSTTGVGDETTELTLIIVVPDGEDHERFRSHVLALAAEKGLPTPVSHRLTPASSD